jgi:hypothetical protein
MIFLITDWSVIYSINGEFGVVKGDFINHKLGIVIFTKVLIMAVPEKIDEFINRVLLNLLKLSNSRADQSLRLKNCDLCCLSHPIRTHANAFSKMTQFL